MRRYKWGIFDICRNLARTSSHHHNNFTKQTPLIFFKRYFFCALVYLSTKSPRSSSTEYTSTIASYQTMQMGHLRHLLQPRRTQTISTPTFLPNKQPPRISDTSFYCELAYSSKTFSPNSFIHTLLVAYCETIQTRRRHYLWQSNIDKQLASQYFYHTNTALIL